VRRLLLVPALALAVTAAVAVPAGAGDQEHYAAARPRVAVGGGVSVVLPTGWHLTHGHGTPLIDPIPRLTAGTFAVRFSREHCVCDTPRVANFPRTGAFLFVMEYPALGRRDLKDFPRHTAHARIGRSAIRPGDCGPSDTRFFREAGRGYQVQIYLGPAAPPSARAQIAAILDSWRVTAG
jgi:hypothetical protein